MYFIEKDKEVTELELYSLNFSLESIPIYVNFKGVEICCNDNILYWTPTNKFELIDEYNPPILSKAPAYYQLLFNGEVNYKLVDRIYNDSIMYNALEKVHNKNHYIIRIFDKGKLNNSINEAQFKDNSWEVWTDLDNNDDFINDISMLFRRQYLKK